MASALAFDTYAYIKKLRDVGVPEPQAAVQVEAITALIEERMATRKDLEVVRRDLESLRGELKRDLKELETELKRDMKELEMRLLLRLGGLGVVGIGVIATLIKIL